ncbi:uncharacterized protein CC84DRAFT_1205631 [Paraphaeosphaeria sporulosa]|uniref:Uncharacterized protein n=1 Tax=Paraphaeosphaeria sporulosa TaxID=1460663 RepID=A0A177CF74_9PLEO|nr:uncharacterized protein CC84DRAFT_1205631 [Paraphaeosphaeria sporulosa]OAG05986.1 hypothetical protein CC84DRAFT_1205631 [Paraphaeosphaeria sporulosa]
MYAGKSDDIERFNGATQQRAAFFSRLDHTRECIMIFPSASSVLLAAVDGTLTRRLLTDTELAWQIDNVSPPSVRRSATASGYRRFFWTPSHRSPAHITTLMRLTAGITRRYPPAECGYSVNSHVRLAQHRAHKSSNYVMNLVEDICAYLYRSDTFSQLFTMQPFIVALLFRPEQAAVVEIFLSGLLQVWVDEGGGLNAYPAGRSVANPWRVGGAQWVKEN